MTKTAGPVYKPTEFRIAAEKFAADLGLGVAYAPEEEICFSSTATNRPGLLLAGFDTHFPVHRVQALGNAENAYLDSLAPDARRAKLERLFEKKVPCVIVSQGHGADETMKEIAAYVRKGAMAYLKQQYKVVTMKEIAARYGVALLLSDATTGAVMSDCTQYLTAALAESATIHGELLDISGIGVLIIGDTGIGKSETALELVHRGHMLVADDLVEVKRIKNKIYGYPSRTTANLLEVRGVGLIDVEAMYGVGGVLNQKRIHLVIEMEKWRDDKTYDRLGDERLTYDILGVEFERIVVPVSAGRNLAVVIEAASRNFRLRSMGRDALDELSIRLMEKNRPGAEEW